MKATAAPLVWMITFSVAFALNAADPPQGTPLHTGSKEQRSADASIEFLNRQMDQYHQSVIVYEDVSSAGNHFLQFGKIPSASAPIDVNGSWTDNPHSGATCIRSEFAGPGFAGFYMMNGVLLPGATSPSVNFGNTPDAGLDLDGALTLTFWARGQTGNEVIEFFLAGIGRNAITGTPTEPFPDSSPRHPQVGTTFPLTTDWTQFTIDVSSLDLSYVLGGFGWVVSDTFNPQGAVFFLDDIQYSLTPEASEARLNEPRFIVSFETLPLQPDPFDPDPNDDIDLVLRNLAFSYDNALAIFAYLSHATFDSIRRALLLGDAFIYALENDRFFDQGPVRTAYQAGDISLPPGWIPNNRPDTVPIPGFFWEPLQQFFEIEQESVDVGNNAWVMIALLALFHETQDWRYLDGARLIGNFLPSCKNEDPQATYQGFQGGIDGPEGPTPTRRVFASSEHNLDVIAAFTTMFETTGEQIWIEGAEHARQFIEDMWEPTLGCYLAGTINPSFRNTNPGQLPLDVQAWAGLASPDIFTLHPELLECAEITHHTRCDGFLGFDFNDDRDGVWFEGTAHMGVAYSHCGKESRASEIRQHLRIAQETPPFGDGGGLAATNLDALSTGFGFNFFRRLHIAATSSNVFSQLRYNPFLQEFPNFDFLRGDCNGDASFDGIPDGLFLLALAFLPSQPPPLCLEACDTDADGTFNGIVDGIYALTAAFVPGGPLPPSPYPNCGPDPDFSSTLGCYLSACP